MTRYYCNPDIADFVYSISAMVGPVHHIVPLGCLPTLIVLSQARSLGQEAMLTLQASAPVLHKMVLTVLAEHHSWPRELDVLLQCLIVQSRHLLTKVGHPALVFNHQWKSAFEEFVHTGHFFPYFPVRYSLPKYGELEEEAVCEKTARSGKNLGAGVLAVFCLKHKVIVGFVLLKEHESPKIVMEVLLTRQVTCVLSLYVVLLALLMEGIFCRFRHVPCVVYDNACRLYQYIANREPVLLQLMTIMSDSYHSKNHKACAETFNFAKQWCKSSCW